jgi:hypothetical protein
MPEYSIARIISSKLSKANIGDFKPTRQCPTLAPTLGFNDMTAIFSAGGPDLVQSTNADGHSLAAKYHSSFGHADSPLRGSLGLVAFQGNLPVHYIRRGIQP